MPRIYTARLEKSSDPNANEPVARPRNALRPCANSASSAGDLVRAHFYDERGLVSYGTDQIETYRRAASCVDCILRVARAGRDHTGLAPTRSGAISPY